MQKKDLTLTRKPPATTPRAADPWHDWQPRWSDAKGMQAPSPHDVQERHHPTESKKAADDAGAQTAAPCRRRLTDARLWESLDACQQDAAFAIATSFESMSRGLGFMTSDWQRIPGSRGAGGDPGRLGGLYVDWAKACHKADVSHSMIIDILCYGISCRALDRDRRQRSGASRRNLVAGLDLYAEMRGWRRPAR
jgi:hypothetical protein